MFKVNETSARVKGAVAPGMAQVSDPFGFVRLTEMLKFVPAGAEVVAAGGSRSERGLRFELVYLLNGETGRFAFSEEGGEA